MANNSFVGAFSYGQPILLLFQNTQHVPLLFRHHNLLTPSFLLLLPHLCYADLPGSKTGYKYMATPISFHSSESILRWVKLFSSNKWPHQNSSWIPPELLQEKILQLVSLSCSWCWLLVFWSSSLSEILSSRISFLVPVLQIPRTSENQCPRSNPVVKLLAFAFVYCFLFVLPVSWLYLYLPTSIWWYSLPVHEVKLKIYQKRTHPHQIFHYLTGQFPSSWDHGRDIPCPLTQSREVTNRRGLKINQIPTYIWVSA